MRTLTQSDIYHVLSYKEYARLQKKPNPYDAMHKDEVEVHNAKRQLSDNTTTSNKGRKRSRKHTWVEKKKSLLLVINLVKEIYKILGIHLPFPPTIKMVRESKSKNCISTPFNFLRCLAFGCCVYVWRELLRYYR